MHAGVRQAAGFALPHEFVFWKIQEARPCFSLHVKTLSYIAARSIRSRRKSARKSCGQVEDIGKDAVDPSVCNFCCIREHPWQVETKVNQVCIERPETVSVVQLLHGFGGVILVFSMLGQCTFMVPR